jgi:spore maturation protein CgeB/SAM-dependent methyltransferase
MTGDGVGDRVNEVYRGEIFETETQRTCRDRIHWMCRQVVGNDVLDIGCSQGITSLLLGREGHHAVGVDINPDAIQYAQAELEREPEHVRSNVQFHCVCGDDLPFAEGSFDSVLLGEILEHLGRPDRILAEARRLLRPQGRVVITTPFGVHPHPDHVQTFYLSGFLQLVSKFFTVHSLSVSDGYINCVGINGSVDAQETDWSPERLLLMSEAAYQEKEHKHWAKRDALSQQRKALREDLTKAREQLRSSRQALRQLEKESRTLDQRRQNDLLTRNAALRELQTLLTGSKECLDVSELAKRANTAMADTGSGHATTGSSVFGLLMDAVRTFADRFRQLQADQGIQLAELQERYQAELSRMEQQIHVLTQKQNTERHDRLAGELEATRTKLMHLTDACDDLHAQLSREKRRAESLQVKCGVWSDHLDDLMHSVRWRVGDLLVNLADSPLSAFRLPFQLAHLFREGRQRRKSRSNIAAENHDSGDIGRTATPSTSVSLPKDRSSQERKAATPVRPAVEPSCSDELDDTNGGVIPRRELNVACILDEFSLTCFRPEARLFELTPGNWLNQIERAQPAFLFVESAWRGRNESWRHLVTCTRRDGDGPLRDIVDYCRKKNIPTVFWNKEDPANFEHFIETAKWFDIVFTTDSDCLDQYRTATGHDRCFTLPFAAQERIHHPIGRRGGEMGRVAFAGTWYSHKHDGRREDAEIILEPALEFGLHIYDRMHTYTGPGWQHYQWPAAYQSAIRGGLPYQEMLDAYRKYDIFLNVNSVRNSPTMCARRVFEILACGTNVISAYTPANANLLGTDCVFEARSPQETRAHLELLLSNEAARNRASVRGIRRIMASHTYVHRFARILEAVGRPEEVRDPKLACLMTVGNREEMNAARKFVDSQTYAGFQPIWLVADAALQSDCPDPAQVFTSDAEWTSAVLAALDGTGADLVMRWTPQTPLGGEWVEDLVMTFRYFDGDGAGKPLGEPADKLLFRKDEQLPLATTILRSSTARRIASALFRSEAFEQACRDHSLTLLATDTVGL